MDHPHRLCHKPGCDLNYIVCFAGMTTVKPQDVAADRGKNATFRVPEPCDTLPRLLSGRPPPGFWDKISGQAVRRPACQSPGRACRASNGKCDKCLGTGRFANPHSPSAATVKSSPADKVAILSVGALINFMRYRSSQYRISSGVITRDPSQEADSRQTSSRPARQSRTHPAKVMPPASRNRMRWTTAPRAAGDGP